MAVVTPLAWDSAFFERRIGVLAGDLTSAAAVAQAVEAARAEGFEYLLSRPAADNPAGVRRLEAAGFYLTDVGVTWASPLDGPPREGQRHPDSRIRAAVEHDIPWMAHEAAQLFRLSRFYHDPFFTEAEADRLHAAWVANSVRGQAADAVWVIEGDGFATCRDLGDGWGSIPLIGVRRDMHGAGIGRALMWAAFEWCAARGLAGLRVKTQVRNLPAMNFYHRLGFDLEGTDVTMGCVLRPGARRSGAAE